MSTIEFVVWLGINVPLELKVYVVYTILLYVTVPTTGDPVVVTETGLPTGLVNFRVKIGTAIKTMPDPPAPPLSEFH